MKYRIATLLSLIGINQHLSAEQRHDIAVAAAQAAPGVVASGGASVIGLNLSDLAVIATISFVALQMAYLVWKWRRDHFRELERKAGRKPVPDTDRCDL